MSYPRIRYRRQGVSRDESLVSHEQDLRFKVSDSGEESYLGFDEETNLDHVESLIPSVQNLGFNIPEVNEESYLGPDEATYSNHDEATYSNHDEATYSNHDEATYSNHDEATYSNHNEATYLGSDEKTHLDPDEETNLDHDEETNPSDGEQDDPRCYGICPGTLNPDAISNEHYRRGNDNFDYIKAYWPQTIPRHYAWTGKYPEDERFALAHVEDKIGINLKDIFDHGSWVPFNGISRKGIAPYIATITYSTPPVTLSYAILRRNVSRPVCVFGFKLHLDGQNQKFNPILVSQFHMVKAAEGPGGSTKTLGFLGFEKPPERERSADFWEFEWWVPKYICCRDGFNLHFRPDEVNARSTESSRRAGHRQGARR
ncbi:hypothetical protein X797_010431 [Metarhizium robertsii]|uniref:Uncharacterized protein n=1 Tax=Metarhizium robertsii TaxID=568076 RepID=A0A0A1UP34_9HYPO|nr:hypothetical protein X797_010431 [Metarhizium robertsii]